MSEPEPPTDRDDAPATEPEVAPALAELSTLADRAPAEHADVYERIHTELQGALSSIDDA